ncbi:MAG: ABC transporter ATP-binding protein [Anaerolineaceae bacterium]|nr:ABC transporter ATP-binding protein [Anaerolineaceae bacterium]
MPTESEKLQTSQSVEEDRPAIELRNVSVQYRLPTERMGTLKEYAIRWVQRKISFNHFWALNDVSFTVKKGEVFGLIGHNGAGKSTTLKVISRVLRPTKGRVLVYGKISPLIELGAGFHPELSGRENIFLNGALLGYTREEMEAVFDEIVDFAELRPFIDAPIRTYSSGMYARLGFAVATAHVPEILILDEILSVGDEAFQKKSFDRLQGFQSQGTTVVMVSHGMGKVEELCDRAALLEHGRLTALGKPAEVIKAYRSEKD